jgi:hypothetical protein
MIFLMKRFFCFLAVVLFLVFSNSFVFAQAEEGSTSIVPIPRPPSDSVGFLGQSHSYSVVFRGNGEAVVTARIAFTNLDKDPLSSFVLQFPRVSPTEIITYQVIKEPTCIRYGNGINPVCLEYQESDYFQPYWGNSKYQVAQNSLKGDMLTIGLPNPIPQNKSGAFFIYFRAFGFAKRDFFGAYNFSFETLKVTDKIRDLQVGISTDSDLVLKNASGKVGYRVDEAVNSLKAAAPSVGAISNAAFDNFYNQIGQGSITKVASNLAPSETYRVAGVYADNTLKLYAKNIAVGVVIAVGVLVLVLVIIITIMRIIKVSGGVGSTKINNKFLIITLSGLGSAFAASAYTGLLVAVFSFVNSNFTNGGYYYGNNSSVYLLVMLFAGLISFVLYSLILFGPSFYIGAKFGFGAGIASAVLTLIFLILMMGVFGFIAFLLLPRTSSSPIIYPMMKGSSYGSAPAVDVQTK